MIPVEQIRPGDIVHLPSDIDRPVVRVERYIDGSYVVVYSDNTLVAPDAVKIIDGLEKSLRTMRAGEPVNATRPAETASPDAQLEDDRELLRQVLLGLFRAHGQMADDELVDRYRDLQLDRGQPIAPGPDVLRRRRELVARGLIRDTGEHARADSGIYHTVWAPAGGDEQISLAAEHHPEPELNL